MRTNLKENRDPRGKKAGECPLPGDKNYRPSRHFDRAMESDPYEAGKVDISAELGDDEAALWMWGHFQKHVPPSVIRPNDRAALVTICRQWSLVDRLYKAYSEDLENRLLGNQYSKALELWLRQAQKFGLSPVDRQKLRATVEEGGEVDPMAEMLGIVG